MFQHYRKTVVSIALVSCH